MLTLCDLVVVWGEALCLVHGLQDVLIFMVFPLVWKAQSCQPYILFDFVALNSGKDAERTADKAGDNLSGAAKDAQRGAEKAGDKISGAADDAKRDVKRNL